MEKQKAFASAAWGRKCNATRAAESDISQLEQLLHGEETVLYGDPAYRKEADRGAFEAKGVRCRVNRRAPGGNENRSERWRKNNRLPRGRRRRASRVACHVMGGTQLSGRNGGPGR